MAGVVVPPDQSALGAPSLQVFKFYQITPSTFKCYITPGGISQGLCIIKRKKKEVGSFQRNPQAQAFRMRGEPSASWDAPGLGGVAFSLGRRASYLIHKDKAATAVLQGNVSQTFTLTRRNNWSRKWVQGLFLHWTHNLLFHGLPTKLSELFDPLVCRCFQGFSLFPRLENLKLFSDSDGAF